VRRQFKPATHTRAKKPFALEAEGRVCMACIYCICSVYPEGSPFASCASCVSWTSWTSMHHRVVTVPGTSQCPCSCPHHSGHLSPLDSVWIPTSLFLLPGSLKYACQILRAWPPRIVSRCPIILATPYRHSTWTSPHARTLLAPLRKLLPSSLFTLSISNWACI